MSEKKKLNIAAPKQDGIKKGIIIERRDQSDRINLRIETPRDSKVHDIKVSGKPSIGRPKK